MAKSNEGVPSVRVRQLPGMTGLPDRIRRVRDDLNMGRREAMIALSRGRSSAWAHWEDGTSVPSARMCALMRERWGIDLNWLLTGDGEP